MCVGVGGLVVFVHGRGKYNECVMGKREKNTSLEMEVVRSNG